MPYVFFFAKGDFQSEVAFVYLISSWLLGNRPESGLLNLIMPFKIS